MDKQILVHLTVKYYSAVKRGWITDTHATQSNYAEWKEPDKSKYCLVLLRKTRKYRLISRDRKQTRVAWGWHRVWESGKDRQIGGKENSEARGSCGGGGGWNVNYPDCGDGFIVVQNLPKRIKLYPLKMYKNISNCTLYKYLGFIVWQLCS